MATKTDKANGRVGTTSSVSPPAGMARVGSVANAPWWDIKNGAVLYGVLENVYTRKDERSKTGESKFYQLKLLQSAPVRFGRGKDAKPGVAEAGTVVNMNYGPKTKELEKFIPDILQGAVYTVWCHVDGEKFAIRGGQTMWPIDVRVAQTGAARALEEPDFSDSSADESYSDDGVSDDAT
jgi:hypothetical protein